MDRIDVALGVLRSLRVPPDDLKPIVDGDRRIIDSMTWILLHGAGDNRDMRSTATLVLKSVIQAADSRVLEQLKPDFFRAVLSLVRDRISQQATKAALQVLLHARGWGRNRIKIVEAGGVKEIVELELTTTELNLGVLSQLCASADGRAELVGRAAGITTASKWSLRVSSLADDEGVRILSSPCSYSATTEVLQEMMSVRFCRIRSFQTLMTVFSRYDKRYSVINTQYESESVGDRTSFDFGSTKIDPIHEKLR
ncbi:E3 ubiquitin-protein ligase PUB23-like [Musa acuminata AAA Group]|uniref:E3 ubiquitin-protein ligase PUB23-like n=1 Tax=Musa acuminata AAA Group TaxID=214697 RepID=UPI0031E2C7FB